MEKIIKGKYEILKKLGRGGMSTVYLCMDVRLGKQWALKCIKKGSDTAVGSALKEANLMKNLDHPALPRIVDIFEDSKNIYVVMDYVDGISLARILEERGRFPEKRVIAWGRRLADVLCYLHSRTPPIIHRDLKPANIMLTGEGNIKLIDFGIAREYKDENLRDTTYLGTKGYAAPEQFKGVGQTDSRTDIYSLGVTLYTLLTGKDPGKPPYEIYPIRHWDQGLSRGLESIVSKCTRQNPKERYENAGKLLYALEHIKEEDPEFIRSAIRKLRIFFLLLLSLVFSVFCLLGGNMMKSRLIAGDYDNNMRLARTALDPEEKQGYYLNAIKLGSGVLEPYFGLIDLYKEDGVFTKDEEVTLIARMEEDKLGLAGAADYGYLAYGIGKLYWHYYEYGRSTNSNISGMKSSLGWFYDALEYLPENTSERKRAGIYTEIGKFNRDIILSVEEAGDEGMYGEYFYNLKDLVENVREERNEVIRLDAVDLCTSAFDVYTGKFRQDGVSLNDMETLLKESMEVAKNTDAGTEKYRAIKEKILSNASGYDERIKRIYGKEAYEYGNM